MTSKASRALSRRKRPNLERRHPPVPVYLAGTVVVMNVCATVLSLMT